MELCHFEKKKKLSKHIVGEFIFGKRKTKGRELV